MRNVRAASLRSTLLAIVVALMTVAPSWAAPWSPFERAARRIHREGRRATREIVRGEQATAKAGRSADREEDRATSEESSSAAQPEAEEQATEESAPSEASRSAAEPWSIARWSMALAAAALAGAAGVAGATRLRRRSDAPAPSGQTTIPAPARSGQTTMAAPIAAPAPVAASVAMRAPAQAKAARTFDEGPRYEILERIGAGGMGVVYRARDRRLAREVALKRLSEQLIDHPKAVRYFLREARAVAGLSHPNIVTLFDVDEEDGVPFLTMELLEGRNLSQLVAERGAFSSSDTAQLGVQAAAGLACAHRQGIVHRDVKSANLFLTSARVVKVMDFGLATMAEELRRAGTVLGTPQYMAPEQARGTAADHRVDLYALGVTLFHLATASWPFPDGDAGHHHVNTPAPDPRTRRPDLSAPLAELILACMAKEPDKRPATADDVAARLRAIAAN